MVNLLPEQKLAQWEKEAEGIRPQRTEALDKLDLVQGQEQKILQEGVRAAREKDKGGQRTAAERLMRCRRDVKKAKAQFSIQDKQLQILETRIHNAGIKQIGETIKLPRAEVLAQESAEAEVVMQELTAAAELAATIEVGVEETYSQSEEDILAEFAAAAEASAKAEPADASAKADVLYKPREEEPLGNRFFKEYLEQSPTEQGINHLDKEKVNKYLIKNKPIKEPS